MIFYSELPQKIPGQDHVDTVAFYLYNLVAKFGKSGGIHEKTVYDLFRIDNQRMFDLYKRRLISKGISYANGVFTYGVPFRDGYVYDKIPSVKRNDPYYKNMLDYITYMVRKRPGSLFSFTDSVQKPFYMKLARTSPKDGATTSFIVDLSTCGHTFTEYKEYIENDYELNHSAQLNQVGNLEDASHITRVVLIMENLQSASKIKTQAEAVIAVPYQDERGLISFKGYNAREDGA